MPSNLLLTLVLVRSLRLFYPEVLHVKEQYWYNRQHLEHKKNDDAQEFTDHSLANDLIVVQEATHLSQSNDKREYHNSKEYG